METTVNSQRKIYGQPKNVARVIGATSSEGFLMFGQFTVF